MCSDAELDQRIEGRFDLVASMPLAAGREACAKRRMSLFDMSARDQRLTPYPMEQRFCGSAVGHLLRTSQRVLGQRQRLVDLAGAKVALSRQCIDRQRFVDLTHLKAQ